MINLTYSNSYYNQVFPSRLKRIIIIIILIIVIIFQGKKKQKKSNLQGEGEKSCYASRVQVVIGKMIHTQTWDMDG